MTEKVYQQIIQEGIRGLPTEILSEIIDFIYFLRKKQSDPKKFEEEMYQTLIRDELKTLNRDEELHLEKEFENYEQRYPIE